MKDLIKFLSLFLISLFLSCNKNSIVENEFVNPKEAIGIAHNEYLLFLVKETKSRMQNKIDKKMISADFIKQSLSSNVSITSIDQPIDIITDLTQIDHLDYLVENFEELNFPNWISTFGIEGSLKSNILQTVEMFKSETDLKSLLNSIHQKELNASNIFQGSELELYYEHLAVARHSAIFWASAEDGGMNGLQHLVPEEEILVESRRINWWKVLGVDCVGGVMGGPKGYAGASLISVIMQL